MYYCLRPGDKKFAFLQLNFEHNPKWQVLSEVLTEIHTVMSSEAKQAAKSGRKSGKVVRGDRAGGATVLVMVRDEMTVTQLQRYLSRGGRSVVHTQFCRYGEGTRLCNAWDGNCLNLSLCTCVIG